MSAIYYVVPTNYGLSLIGQAHVNAQITLKNLVLGDANGNPYSPLDHRDRVALVNQRAAIAINQVMLLPNGNTRIITVIPSNVGGFNIHEIGLTDQNDQLIYIGNYHGGYKPVLEQGAGSDLNLFIDIKPQHGAPVLINADPTGASLNLIAQAIWHVGSWHGTDQQSWNPAINLIPFFGYQTQWRLRPYAPYGVETLTDALLQKINIGGNGSLASTSRIWKRLPDDYQDPIYQLSVDKTQVNEGESVTFTLNTQNVASGTSVGYVISGIQTNDLVEGLTGLFIVDENGSATKTISVKADQLTEGSETLKLTLVDETAVFKTVLINDTSINLVPSYELSANRESVNEGQSITFTLNTQNVASGTSVGYVISGVSVNDISLNSLTGNLIVGSNGSAVLTINVLADQLTEGSETLRLSLINQPSVFKDVFINDTSFHHYISIEYYSPAYPMTMGFKLSVPELNQGDQVTLEVQNADGTPYPVTQGGDIGFYFIAGWDSNGVMTLDENKESTFACIYNTADFAQGHVEEIYFVIQSLNYRRKLEIRHLNWKLI